MDMRGALKNLESPLDLCIKQQNFAKVPPSSSWPTGLGLHTMMSEIMEALSSGCAHHTSGVRLIAKRLTKRGKASTALTSFTWSWRTVVDPAERSYFATTGIRRSQSGLCVHTSGLHCIDCSNMHFSRMLHTGGIGGNGGGKDLLLLEAHDV